MIEGPCPTCGHDLDVHFSDNLTGGDADESE
jgi:hypothetical protein